MMKECPPLKQKNDEVHDNVFKIKRFLRKFDGFIPFYANLFDRGFISVVILVGAHLFWLRFMEHILPIGFATLISLVIAVIVIRWG